MQISSVETAIIILSFFYYWKNAAGDGLRKNFYIAAVIVGVEKQLLLEQ